MVSPQRRLHLMGRRLRAHWRGISAGLLAGAGTLAGLIAGVPTTPHRLLWLIGAGVCAGLAVLISVVPARHHKPEQPGGEPRPIGTAAKHPTLHAEEVVGAEQAVGGGTVAGPLQQSPGGANLQSGGDIHVGSLAIGRPSAPDRSRNLRQWAIPPPVRSFTGRSELLVTVREQLVREGAAALVPMTALYGMGGIGKTQLALAYAHHYRKHYELGWWIPAETEVSVTTALAELAVALGLSAKLPIPELAGRVEELLEQKTGWLLVYDNVIDPTSVARFLPAVGRGHVLLTSRNPAWQGIADPLHVDVLPLDDAVELLRKRSGDSDRNAAMALAAELGQLPLALEQAAAYVGQYLGGHERPLARYLELFQERRASLLARGRPLAYEGTVDATFTLALDRLRDASLPAVQLMEVCALLATDELPIDLLLGLPERLPIPLANAAGDPLAREETLGALYQAGFLIPDRGGIARTHRVVQIVTRAHLSDSDRHERLSHTVELLANLFPDEGWEPSHRARCVQLLPHARALLDHAGSEQLATPALADLLTVVGRYLWGRRLDLRGAQVLYERSLAINRQLYDGDHPAIARSLSNLAGDLRALGEIERAQALDKQALEMRQRLYEGDHPTIARSLSNLASDLRALGEIEQAQALDKQAVEMRQRLYEGDHPDFARSFHGLASDLRALGEMRQAQALDKQALEMRQRLYEGDHPAIAFSMNNLALDLHLTGEVGQAEKLNGQALAMHRRLHEGDHPHVATSLNNLANDLYALGQVDRARELDLQALTMRRRLYDGDHSATLESLSNLAADLHTLGGLEQAQELREQASAMRRRLQHADHAAIKERLGNPAVDSFQVRSGRWARALDD